MDCYQKALHVNVWFFCLCLLHFWLDIVFLSILEGEHSLRLERAVYRDLHDLSVTVPRVNLSILISIAVCHTHQDYWWAMYTQYMWNTVYMWAETCQNVGCLLNEHTLSVSTLALLKVGEMFWSYHGTMYFIFLYICKSNCCVTDYFIEGFCHILQLCNFENFHRSRHLYFLISRIISPR